MLRRYGLIIVAVLFSLSLAGCYQIPVQQGTLLSYDQVQAIHKGMSVRQVERILGTPILDNIYADNRLLYVYSLKVHGHPFHVRRLIITFRNRRVVDIQTNVHEETLPKPRR